MLKILLVPFQVADIAVIPFAALESEGHHALQNAIVAVEEYNMFIFRDVTVLEFDAPPEPHDTQFIEKSAEYEEDHYEDKARVPEEGGTVIDLDYKTRAVDVIQTIIFVYIDYMSLYWLETFTRLSLLYDVTQKVLHLASSAAITSHMILGKLYARKFIDTFNRLHSIEQILKGEFQADIPHKKIAYISIVPILICGFLECSGMIAATVSFFAVKHYILFVAGIFFAYASLSLQIVHGQFLNGILIYRSLFSGIRNHLIELFATLHAEVKYLQALQNSSKIHQELCENLRDFNELLSIQLLFCFMLHYVQICMFMFVWVLFLSSENEEDSRPLMMMLLFCLGIVFKLGVTIINSYLCINEMSKLMAQLYKISNSKGVKIEKEINNFALQLLHEKIEITAAGFFDIDVKLIFSVIAAVATHTIILIQFDSEVNVYNSFHEL
ncbi:putative gustatory receptor [Trypoxylus dichotomus]